MRPRQAIRAVIVAGADRLALDGGVGCVKAHCYADVIAVADNLLTCAEAPERVHFMVTDGVVYKREGLASDAAGS